MSAVAGDGVDAAVRRETDPWIEPVGRIGLAVQGVLYVVVGVLALQVASGRSDPADQRGAIEAVADQRFGRVLLLVLTVGLALHCCWRFVLAARGGLGDDDAGDVAKRIANVGRGLIYGSFTVIAAKILIDAGGSKSGGGGGGGEQKKAVGTALDWPGGEVLVVLVGVAVIAAGLWNASRAFTRNFVDHLNLSGRSDPTRKAIIVMGSIGYLARGVVFCMIGWFLVESALDDDPNHTGGFDRALRRLADSGPGPALLRVVALGLILFGTYRVVDARLRVRSAVTNS